MATEEKDVTVVPTAKRRTKTKKEIPAEEKTAPAAEETIAAVEQEEGLEEAEAAAEELKAMDAAENLTSKEASEASLQEEEESKAFDNSISGEPEIQESVPAEQVETSKQVESEMMDEKPEDVSPAPVTEDEVAKSRKAAVRKEKEKILTQVSIANAPRSESVHQIKGIVQASRDEKREIYSDQGIIPLGEEVQFKTEGQKRREEYISLVSSKRSHNYLTGTIYSITTHGGHICAVVRYGSFTVLIPSENLLGTKEENAIAKESDETKKFMMRRRYATQRIGSQIDFVVEAVDEVEMVAIANRHEAMEIKKQAWYLSHDQGNEPLLNKGTRVEARVVVAARNYMFVEVFGIEFMLREHDIAYVQIPNVAAEYPVGSTVPVIFTKLEREHTESGMVIHAQVSIKEAMSDPRKREFDSVQVKDVLSATVTGVIENGIIVRIGGMRGNQDAMCQYQKKNPTNAFASEAEIPPIGKNVLIKIRKKEEFDSKKNPIYRVYGDILRVL